MARKRDQIPPFEIMRRSSLARRPSETSEKDKPPQHEREPQDASEAQTDSAQLHAANDASAEEPAQSRPAQTPEPSSWVDRVMVRSRQWLAGGAPIMIRLPRGMAVVLMAGALVLLVLAYFAGHSQGYSAGQAAAEDRFNALSRASARGMPAIAGHVPANGQTSPDGRGRVFLPGDADPRQPGLNYLIAALYPLEEAKELANFIADSGVDVLVVSADNAGRFHVIPLVGFDRQQYATRQHEAFEQAIGRLGREWYNLGKGDDLSMRYWKRYESP